MNDCVSVPMSIILLKEYFTWCEKNNFFFIFKLAVFSPNQQRQLVRLCGAPSGAIKGFIHSSRHLNRSDLRSSPLRNTGQNVQLSFTGERDDTHDPLEIQNEISSEEGVCLCSVAVMTFYRLCKWLFPTTYYLLHVIKQHAAICNFQEKSCSRSLSETALII